jgi:hypothetical protein
MGAKRTQYQIVGRYMNGQEVTGYHLQSLDTGKSGMYTREQVAYLVGRDQVTNCSGQIYKDKVLLRGIGMSLEDLPVQQEDGSLTRTSSVGHIRRGATTGDVMTQVIIVGVITDGRNVVGYQVQNSGGGTGQVSRDKLLELARAGRIGNARVQMYQGKPILKGINCDLKQLPKISVNQA